MKLNLVSLYPRVIF